MDRVHLDGLPEVRVQRHTKNLGFAAGNNRAAEIARGRWLVLLNPDATAAPDWLDRLEHASQDHPECRVFTSAQIALGAPQYMDGAGDAYLLFGFPWRGGYGHPVLDLPETGYCFSGCGAGVMYDRQLFLDHGGFDERFFCYCEDVDLGFRLQRAGEACLYVRDAVIHHAGSAISGPASEFTIYHGTRNRVWTYVKNMPLMLLALTLPVHLALSVYLLARSASIQRFAPTWRGMKDGWHHAFRLRASAPWRAPKRQVSHWRLARTMTWNPWRMSRRQVHVRPAQPQRAPQPVHAFVAAAAADLPAIQPGE